MSYVARLPRQASPWRVAAILIAALALLLMQGRHAEAAIAVNLTLNDNIAGAQTDLTLDLTLDVDLNPGETITVTLPAGWTVADGDLTGSVSWSALMDVTPTITGNSAARTITTTTAAGQMAALPGLQMTISPGASIVNPAAPAAGLTITVDADNGNAQGTSAPFNIVAPAASAALTGTIQGGANTEGDIVAGGGTIILTLTGDTWVAAGATFDAQRQNIINGIDSAGAEAAGWDAVVKAGLVVGDVVRTSATVVTITLPAFAGYDITANETITATIPGSALTGAAPIVAAPTFTVLAASAAVTGTIQGGANAEADIVAGAGTIIITLTNDTWVAAGATFDAQRQNIINGIDSAGAEGAGWDAVVKAGLAVGDVVRTSATVVTVTLPAFAGYNITANETITVTVPASAIASAGALVATPTFNIVAAAGPTAVTAVSFAGSSTLQNAASTYTVTFTASGSGALAAGGTVTVVMTGFSLTNGATAVTLGGAFVGTAAGNVAGGNTLTVTLNGGASLANSATGTIAFATTNPGAGTIAAAGLTVATSSDTTVVQSGNSITITAPAPVVEPPLLCAAGTFSGNGFAPCQPCPAGQTSAQGATQCTVTPKLTDLAVLREGWTSLSDLTSVTLVDGQTSYTLTVPERRYYVAAAANRGTLTYRNLTTGVAFDPNTTLLTLPATVVITITVPDGPAVSYTLSVRAPQRLLAFAAQPSGAVANTAFTTQPRVEIREGTARLTSATDTVTLSIKAGTGTPGAVLTSTATAAVAGRAEFTNVKIDRAGTGYVLVASSGSLTVESEPFNVAEAIRPRLTALALVPLTAAGAFDVNVPFSDYPRANLTGDQTTFTLPVVSGRSYRVAAEVNDGEITYRRNGLAFDPATTRLSAGDTITIQAVNSAGTSPTYTVRLGAATPVLATLALVPTQSGYQRIDVPVVPGQTIYEVTVPAYDATARAPRYNLSATMTGTDVQIRVQALGNEWAPTSIAFQSGETGTFTGTTSAGTSPTYTVRLVTPAQITGVRFSASPTTPTTSTRITVAFTSSTPLRNGDRIMLAWTDFSVTTGVTAAATRAGGFDAGVTFAASGASANGITLTLTGTGGLPARTEGSLVITGYTTPTAKTIAKAGLTVRTNEVTTAVASSTDILIGAQLTNAAVTLSSTAANATNVETTITFTTPVAIPVGGRIRVTLTGFTWPATPTVAFASGTATATSAFAANVLTVTTSTAAIAANSTVTLRVTGATLPAAQAAKTDVRMSVSSAAGAVLAETQTGTLVAIVAAQPRLEFVTQPSDSTTGVADINVTVRALKADGTVDTAFNNQVQLTIQGAGSSYGLGSVTAIRGVATFTRTYNPSRADATWTLRATQISGRAAGVFAPATSESFRVTKPPTLAFTQQPVGGTAGAALTTQPIVTAYKADGTVDTAFTGTVTLTLKSDTANGAVLTSTATAAVAGRATFAGTSVNNAGTDYALVASATGYTSVASESFSITSGATQIVITQYPSTFVVGRDHSIEVRAAAGTADGRIVPGAAGQLGLILNGNNTTLRIATTPTAVENGVAIFRVTHRFASAGEYRWGVDHVGGSRNLPQADTEAFTVAKPASKLAFVVQPGGFGSVLGTQPVVEIQDEDGNRVPGATNEVTLTFRATNDTDPIMTGGARRAATAGQVKYTAVGFTGGTARPGSTFTITATATGLTSATSDRFGPAGPTTKLAFTSDLPCGLVARPGCSPAAREGQQFTITVAAQDAAGQVNRNENGTVTLTGDGNSGMAARTARFVDGVATFTGVSFASASTTGFTLTATSGALTVSSGRIVVTADDTPASLRFIAVPTHEVTGQAFVTRPQVEVLNAAGRRITSLTGVSISLSLHKQGGTTASVLSGTSSLGTELTVSAGTAIGNGIRVTGADTGLYLTATLRRDTGDIVGTQTGTFRVYASASEATTARTSEQTRSTSSSLTLNLGKSSAGSIAASSLKKDICTSLSLDATSCARVSITTVVSSSRLQVTDGTLVSSASTAIADEEIVTLGGLNLRVFEADTGATAPAGTTALYAVARIASDAYGNRLEQLSAPRSFSLPVPESVLLPGARPDDLRIGWWDETRWVQVPTQAVIEEDGSFRVTATTNLLGAFAVLYAPGASRISGFTATLPGALGLGIFEGGSVAALEQGARLNDASGVWVRDAINRYRVLLVDGPAFLKAAFASHFPGGFAPQTPVWLVRAGGARATATTGVTTAATTPASSAAATSGTSGTAKTYLVQPGDTLSGIGARLGVDWMRIAAANGIAGPNYFVRDGQVLTIPR